MGMARDQPGRDTERGDARSADRGDRQGRRAEIELFFKWIKQHLKVKRFAAVLTQLWVATCMYLLLAYLKFVLRLCWIIGSNSAQRFGSATRADRGDRQGRRADAIILFGSAARGEMRAKSDLDVLVVIADGQHRGHAAEAIYCAKPRRTRPLDLARRTRPLDLVVATESDVEHQHDAPWYVIAPALREGRVLYDRTAACGTPRSAGQTATGASSVNRPTTPPSSPSRA